MNTTRGARKKCKFGIAALCTGKLIAPLQYEGAMNGLLFECWFKKTLLTTCPKSASSSWKMPFHKKKVVYPIAKKPSHPLMPYSLEFNLIEHTWSALKRKGASQIHRYSSVASCTWKT